MKTPNKIYVAEVTFPDMIDWDGSPINTRRIDETDIEYIRKDALLEWAEDYVRKTKNPEMWCTMKIVINKLKSI